MLDIVHLPVFLISSFVLAISPGPDILFVFTEGLQGNKKNIFGLCFGVSIGNIVQTTLGALGLALIVKEKPILLKFIVFFGACYLIYLAYQNYLKSKKSESLLQEAGSNDAFLPQFKKGILVNLFNPKVSLFFISFFPGFIEPGSGLYAESFFVLGLLFTLLAYVVFMLTGLLAGQVGSFLFKNERRIRIFFIISAFIYVLLAIYVVVSNFK